MNTRTRSQWRCLLWLFVATSAPVTASAPPGTGLWGGSQWITSDQCAPRDEIVAAWEQAALLSLQAQQPSTSPENLAEWKKTASARLAEARSPVVFHKTFSVARPVRSAELHICGLGYFQALVNGAAAGDHARAPNLSHYDTEARFLTIDVSRQIHQGDNSLELTVAPGRLHEVPGHFAGDQPYSKTPLLRAVLTLRYTDGGTERIATDSSWLAGVGPIRRAAFWVGEVYDAGAARPEWSPVSRAAEWNPTMVPDSLPPQRVVRELHPVAVSEPQPGVWVYDFGEMTVGKARLRLPPNTRATVRYAELKVRDLKSVDRPASPHAPFLEYPPGTDVDHPDMIRPKARGSVSMQIKRKGQRNQLQAGFVDLVQSADSPLDWSGSFDYLGFRYVEITGPAQPLPKGAVTALEIHNDVATTGRLTIAHPALQAVANAAARSILLNTQGTYEDNPGAERMGANSNIAALSYPHAWYAFDNRALARKALEDSITAARLAGAPTTVTLTRRHVKGIPEVLAGREPKFAPITVIDAFHYGQTPLDTLRFYGDRETAAAALDHSAFYFESLLATGYPRSTKVGDHLDYTAVLDLENLPADLRPTSTDFVVGASALWQGNQFLEAAQQLGRDDLVRRVQPLLHQLREEIQRRHFEPDTGRFAWKTSASRMGANTLALVAGLVPDAERKAWIDEIVEDIRRHNNHLTTGSRLTGPLLSILAREGHIDEAIRLTTSGAYPSPFAMLSLTGGTLSESWGQPGLPAGASFVQAEGLAAAANWLYEALVGISPNTEAPGFRRFSLAPAIPASVPSCSFAFDSPHGRIESSWKQSNEGFQWEIRVPEGATAEIKLPFGKASEWVLPQEGIRSTAPAALELSPGTHRLQYRNTR
jgi:alpha-L-rhamnosidase